MSFKDDEFICLAERILREPSETGFLVLSRVGSLHDSDRLAVALRYPQWPENGFGSEPTIRVGIAGYNPLDGHFSFAKLLKTSR